MRPRKLYPHFQFLFDLYQRLYWVSSVDSKQNGKMREVVLAFDDKAYYHASELRELVDQLIDKRKADENTEGGKA